MDKPETQTQNTLEGQMESNPRSLHTPGPWHIDHCTPETSEGASYALTLVVETNEAHIAFCFNDSPANANLIAAAPELLEACKAQHEAIDRLFARLIASQDDFMPTRSGQPWEAARLGFAAISKAEGAPSVPDATDSSTTSY